MSFENLAQKNSFLNSAQKNSFANSAQMKKCVKIMFLFLAIYIVEKFLFWVGLHQFFFSGQRDLQEKFWPNFFVIKTNTTKQQRKFLLKCYKSLAELRHLQLHSSLAMITFLHLWNG